MQGLGQDRHTRNRRERRTRNRKSGTREDLRHSVARVRQALRNSPTQFLRAEPTSVLEDPARRELLDSGYDPGERRFLQVPVTVARRLMLALRDIWGGSGLD